MMASKKLIVLFWVILPSFLIGQNYTINSSQKNTLIIGYDNLLEIEDYNRNDSLHIEVPSSVRSKRISRNGFSLLVSKPLSDISIILKNREKVIDTIVVSSERVWLKQFIKTDKYGLIKPGEHSLEMIRSIKSIELLCNIPDSQKREITVQRYRIDIYNEKNLILSKTIRGESFNYPEIKAALSQIKKNDNIAITIIKARLPWDDGQQPKSMLLKVK